MTARSPSQVKREEVRHEEHEGYVVRERLAGNFARSFALPSQARGDEITATMEDGVLKVTRFPAD